MNRIFRSCSSKLINYLGDLMFQNRIQVIYESNDRIVTVSQI